VILDLMWIAKNKIKVNIVDKAVIYVIIVIMKSTNV